MNFTDSDYETHIYLDALWRGRYLCIIVMIIMPFFTVLGARMLPQKYTASTSVAVSINALPAMKDISTPSDLADKFEGLKAYISSPSVLKDILIHNGLLKQSDTKLAHMDAVDALRKGLTIELLGKDVIQITLIQSKPTQIPMILNSMSKLLIQQISAKELATAKASLAVLSDSMKVQKLKLKQSVDSLNKYETAHADLLPAYADIYQNQLRQINLDLGNKQAQYSSLQAEEEELRKYILKINPMITQIDRAIFDNESKLNKLRITYTDNYSGIKALVQLNQSLRAERDSLKEQYQKLDGDKIQQLWNIVLSHAGDTRGENNSFQLLGAQLEKLMDMQLKFTGMKQEITSLTQQKSTINQKLQDLTNSQQVFIKLKQAIRDDQNAYEDILNRYNLAKMSFDLSQNENSSVAKVVSYPEKQLRSLDRPIAFFLFLGAISGVFFGFSLVWVLELIDNKARIKRAVEAVTGFEVICRVERLKFH